MQTTTRKRRKSDSINTTTNSRDEPMTMQCWARDSPDETAERHPAFISVNIYNKINRGGGVVDELVWIKWSSTGHKTEIPRSQVSLNLEPRSRRRSAAAAAAMTSRESDNSDDNDDIKFNGKKKVQSTPKQKRRKYIKSSNSTTTLITKRVEKNDNSGTAINPLDRFLKRGINSTRNSSSPLRQKLLETS